MSGAWPYVAAILPTILVATFFYFIVKSIIEGDRRERIAQKKYEQEQERERERSSRPAVADSDAVAASGAVAGSGAVGDSAATADTGDPGLDTGNAGLVAKPRSSGNSPSES